VVSSGRQTTRQVPILLLRDIVSMAPLLLRATAALKRSQVGHAYLYVLLEFLHLPQVALCLRWERVDG
jgi:hypothetical protein